MKLNKIDFMYDISFELAKVWKSRQLLLELMLIILTLTSLFLESSSLYTALIFGVLLRIGLMYLRGQEDKFEKVGHKLQEFSMLYSLYNSYKSYQSELSYLMAIVPDRYHSQHEDDETVVGAEYSHSDLVRKVQENCFWNFHLYQASYERKLLQLSILIIPIIGMVFFSINFLPVNSEYYKVVNLLLVLLSTSVLWDQVRQTLKFKKGSEEMGTLEKSIRQEVYDDESYAVLMYSKYARIKMNTPLVSQKSYERKKISIDESWKARQ